MYGEVYFVRHGHYHFGEELTPDGIAESEQARDSLVASGLGKSAVVLSSNAKRAINTARIIAKGLETTVFSSLRINWAGNNPNAVKNLDTWLGKALEESGAITSESNSLVVVAHEPILRSIAYGSYKETPAVGNGVILTYPPESWQALDYDPFVERYAEFKIEQGEPPYE